MPDPSLIALTTGLVAALRRQFPRVDGPWVYLAVLIVALLVTLASVPVVDLRAFAQQVARVALGAVALASGASYVAGKARPMSTPLEPATLLSVGPPAPSVPPGA